MLVNINFDNVKVGKFRFSIFTFNPPTHIFDNKSKFLNIDNYEWPLIYRGYLLSFLFNF